MAPVVLAAGLDWLEQLLPVLFVAFWIASQVFNAFKAAGRGRQPAPPHVRPQRPPVGPPRADEIRGQLERQIGEFLERQRGGRRGQPAERPQPAAKPQGSRPHAKAAGRPASPSPQPAARPAAPPSGGVARHVQDAFAHEIEHLASSLPSGPVAAAGPRPPAAPVAAELVAMLRNPATLRHLILLREVLDRPSERW